MLPSTTTDQSNKVEVLQEALIHLTQPRFERLQDEIEQARIELLKQDDMTKSAVDAHLKRLEVELVQLQLDLTEPENIVSRNAQHLDATISQAFANNPDAVIAAQAKLLVPIIQHQIRVERDDLSSALAPILGKMINHAIREAMDNLVQQIDEKTRKITQSPIDLVKRSLGLNKQSRAEKLLRDNLPYNVEHVFLIQTNSGLLVSAHDKSADKVADADIISGMLTAISSFVHDSFGGEANNLDAIKYGDHRILLEPGKHVYIAAVVEGIEPSGFQAQMREAVSEINVLHEMELTAYAGDPELLPSFEKWIRPLFNETPVESV